MKRTVHWLTLSSILIAHLLSGVLNVMAGGDAVAPAANGIGIPEGYRDWRILAPSHRTDNNTLRVIVGNDDAIRAAREGRTNPWPDGAILGKIVWKDTTHEAWPAATVPGTFVHAEFMIKDHTKYADTGGWGFARWVGPEQKPYGKGPEFVRECFGCHLPVKNSDYVFTRPAAIP